MASPEGRRATPAARPPPEQGLRCPRCDSSNTKFCYYNNYSLTQPRHFCKACRRYWTKGGALRNVPVGGGCRKNKKNKASAATFAGVGLGPGFHQLPQLPDQKSSQVDQLFPFSKLGSSPNIGSGGHVYNQFLTFGDLSPSPMACANNNIVASSPGSSLDQSGGAIAVPQPPIMGFKPFDPAMSSPSPSIRQAYAGGRINQETGSAANMQINDIASSIESLSSMNQDLHFKLQQQRFALMLGAGGINPRDPASNSASLVENQQIHQLPISFHGSTSSKNAGCGVELDDKMQLATSDNPTELLLDQSSYPSASEMQSWSGMRQFN